MAETMAQAIARRKRERAERENAEWTRLERQRRLSNPPDYVQRPGGGLSGGLREAALQADTAVRSAANSLTLGGANTLAAGLDALAPVVGQSLRQRYANQLAAGRARDQYDAAHRQGAQNIGADAAAALSLFGGGSATPKLIAGAATRSARETAAIMAAGAGSGLVFQGLSDSAAHRPTDWRDGLGAAAGGVVGGAAFPLGAGRAAAVESAATRAAQNVLHGRPLSPEDLARSAAAGRLIGSVAGTVGRRWSDSLSPQAKGKLGEALGTVRSAVNHLDRDIGPKELVRPVAGKPGTIPDGRSAETFPKNPKLFEDKFGPSARLRPGQRLAQSELGKNYIVYHFVPEHVGRILSLPMSGAAPQFASGPVINLTPGRRQTR
jgi:hypothetical protein